jgi:hypothetical protein
VTLPRSTTKPPPEFGWCPRCQRQREIVDEFSDVVQEYAGQRGVHVTQFDCGHDTARDDGTFAPFP